MNRRHRCQAVLTLKRSLENYFTPGAIYEARGIEVEFGDQDDVPDLVAAQQFALRGCVDPWHELPLRVRRRFRYRVKRWLNTAAADCMTVERLAERDPQGEVRGWLQAIAHLLDVRK